ncbi:SET domain-containing protein-lysine N-methyltransferase [Chlorobium sp. KB01]|uniref:SET domain-containing protein-lysine N-methyltransferase n=1 Tax=Chlorobium sp. KB01 TaxID=1917528 RepID=UPI000977EAB7|nr:SET domain-containing protein-lysine N-methyltransferase [Chlorobium sp. KB01]
MKLCVLYSSYDQSDSPTKDYDPMRGIKTYLEGHDVEMADIHKATAVQQVRSLTQQDFDLFINLCDGSFDADCAGIEVVQTLEYFNAPFTGASSDFYDPTREDMKRVARSFGIDTPLHRFVATEVDIEEAALNLRFPLIVKHPNSYASIGMTKTSRTETPEAFKVEAERMVKEFGEALIEEFVEGREFTVLVAENAADPANPVAFPAVEFVFPEGESFKHFDLKWSDYEDMQCIPVDDPDLDHRLRTISAQLFTGLNGSGYGRCDIRMDGEGRLFMLEINPNCGVFYSPDDAGSADFILLNYPDGHQEFLRLLQEAATKRCRERVKNWKIKFDPKAAYGMYASRDIEPGELIEAFEEKEHVLVSLSYAEKHWDSRNLRWLRQYAYPITDEIWVMWSKNPRDWKPVNHSCNPNAWLENMNLVARYAIAAGEEITMDYATFCHATMEEFSCECGEAECRHRITGNDATQPFMQQYTGHVSDYVKTRIAALSLQTA